MAAAFAAASSASGADLAPEVLVKSRWMELTRADYDKAISKLPEKLRFEFATSPRRVQGVLNNLLVAKTLAAQAKAHGTRPSGAFLKGPGDDVEHALATAEIKRIEADANKSFDAQKGAFEAKAREVYTLDRDKYRAPEEVRISDIAISIKDRGDEAALARAREARQRILGGADFAVVAREYSDDAATRERGGAIPFVTAKSLPGDHGKAVLALKQVGELSEPIKAPSAYHVVRLEERRAAHQQTFEEARDSIVRDLRQRYIAEQRDLRIKSIHEDPGLQMNQAAIDALVNHIDPKLMKPAARARPADSAPK